MNRLQPIGFYVGLLAFFIAALVAGSFYFLVGMSDSSYLVSDGARLGTHYLNKPRYDANLQGFIFAISFLVSGGLLVFLIILPDQSDGAMGTEGAPQPQPRRRAAAAPAQQPAAAPMPTPTPPPAQEPPPVAATQSSPLSIERSDGELAGEAPVEEVPQAPDVSVEEEVLKSREDDLPAVDFQDARFNDSDEENVVYGDGRITEDAIWEFIQQYPDSAIKFLYRKTLDNKPLSPTEEDIYRNWDMRGMSRGRVRQIVLDIMGWQSLPDDFPHNIWRELRDQIYEMQTR